VRPVTDERLLQRLDAAPVGALREEFVAQMTALRASIFSRAQPKTLHGTNLDGDSETGGGGANEKVLVNLSTSYVDAINAGGVPSIDNAWSEPPPSFFSCC
jgi:hypothetical protein